jgi:hypothetical protein|tara:strand:- start:63 stop:638 length:576 start_codon:yes stop_codon:yes gene_type:complete
MTAITISEVTSNTATTVGTGTFDVLMESVNNQLLKQWEAGRISGADYASVYLGALQSVLKESVQFTLSKQTVEEQVTKLIAETALTNAKKATEDTNVTDATGGATKDKSNLMAAQALGFANNTKQSLLKSMLDGYSTNLAIAGVANVPESTRDGAIDQLSQNILDSLTTTNTPVRVQIQTVAEVADVDTGT